MVLAASSAFLMPSLDDASIFGAAGVALLKFLGGPAPSYTVITLALTAWLIVPGVLAARILRHIDL